ncbi:uncharacterized protein I303_106298 [Kwoniella dejecticola CBS 10117]|uniref:Uncharacterized protein n=1 Tax=Kwoniella dejecticola CBS 10117 TaxID=1296121 RepID=A0A1A6A1U1_9TREE|nr:uncharacterized protein I303_06318 [Kwoniella dejecticola CBS 10117]OBR84031.1 hypothetical protein I303_06318 [Kwoniella dejecticola CBS 10117]
MSAVYSSAKRYLSSLQQVRGHDPPTPSHFERQGIAQRRTREYLGLEGRPPDKSQQISGRSQTIILALQKAFQAYKSDADTNNEKYWDSRSKGKGKEKPESECTSDAVIVQYPSELDIARPSPRPTPSGPALRHTRSKSPETANPVPIHPLSSQPISASEQSQDAQSTTSEALTLTSETQIPISRMTSTFSLPPTITKLLSARLFRLAVFHTLSTPELASDHAVVMNLASHLEAQGAGKLAKRLRKGWEVSQNQEGDEAEHRSGDGEGRPTEFRLYSDPKGKGKAKGQEIDRLPPDHWRIPDIPPIKPLLDPKLTRSENMTEWYNHQLQFSLKQSPTRTPSMKHPLSPSLPHSISKSGFGLSELGSGSSQLGKLLRTIDKLEKHRGFRPDRRTANLIIGCWLRNAVPQSQPYPRPRISTSSRGGGIGIGVGVGVGFDFDPDVDRRQWREYKDKAGHLRLARKVQPEVYHLRRDDLRILFDVLSKMIVSTRSRAKVKTRTRPTMSSSTETLTRSRTGEMGMTLPSVTDIPDSDSQKPGSEPKLKLKLEHDRAVLESSQAETQSRLNQKEWEEVVRPFGKMMFRSTKNMGDPKGVEMVKKWMNIQRKVLLGEGESEGEGEGEGEGENTRG